MTPADAARLAEIRAYRIGSAILFGMAMVLILPAVAFAEGADRLERRAHRLRHPPPPEIAHGDAGGSPGDLAQGGDEQ